MTPREATELLEEARRWHVKLSRDRANVVAMEDARTLSGLLELIARASAHWPSSRGRGPVLYRSHVDGLWWLETCLGTPYRRGAISVGPYDTRDAAVVAILSMSVPSEPEEWRG